MTNTARTVTILVVTPFRVAFLILVVSATVEALAVTSRHRLRVQRWKDAMRGHYVICGFGTKGRSSAATLESQGVGRESIVIVDFSPKAVDDANRLGYTAVVGDCTQEAILLEAHVERAKGVVVAVDRDDTATLASLSVSTRVSVRTIRRGVIGSTSDFGSDSSGSSPGDGAERPRRDCAF